MKTFFELREETTQVTVGDYTTKHFDICPSAVKLYSKIKGMTPMVHLIVENMMLHDVFFRLEKQAEAQGAIDEDDLDKAGEYAEMIMDNAEQMGLTKEHSYIEDVHMARFRELADMEEDDSEDVSEKTLTPAELKKREEVAKAIKRENPNMPMGKKMAIATATAKKVAEAVNDMTSMGNRSLAAIAKNPNHPDKAAASNELARRRMRSEEVNLDEGVDSLSHARLKFHATKGVSHGSYSNSEIKDEHRRRLRTDPDYVKAKASMNEEAEELDEISKGTLGKYIKLAGHDREQRLKSADKLANVGHNIKSNDPEHANKLFTKAGREFEKAANRKAGINKAVNKLVGEEAVSTTFEKALSIIRKHKTFTEASEDYVYKTQSAARKAFKENDRMRRSEGGAKYSVDDAEEAFADMVSYWIKDKYVPKTASNWTLY